MREVAVITVSDRASKGEYRDGAGPAAVEMLRERFPGLTVHTHLVPDEREEIEAALEKFAGCDWIITTGGTGLSPRDVTPEVTARYCDRAVPGIAEILRAESYKETPFAMLSRGFAGMKGRTVIVNLPGSPRAVRQCMRILLPVMEHAAETARGKGHG